jgi:indole-3-glycerol phosphate synthase
MHSLIESMIQLSEIRAKASVPGYAREGSPRSLIDSAKIASGRGLIPVIAEIKPRILSRPLQQGEAAAISYRYEELGAAAISVITEPSYFLGSIKLLPEVRSCVKLPVLRKDFITKPCQLKEVEADLVLLIAALPIDLSMMVEEARSLGMEPLLEVHTAEEMNDALKTDASIIGINNRDLRSLDIDIGTFERLAVLARDAGVFLVAESGIHTKEDAMRMVAAGARALLVGTSLMRSPENLTDIADRNAPS